MRNDRGYWNERYREGPHSGPNPDPFLIEAYEKFIAPLFPRVGRTLDVAGGTGRHAIWLAQRGWEVDLVDLSEVGLARARQMWRHTSSPVGPRPSSRLLDGKIQFITADLNAHKIPRKGYDLVLVFFYLQRSLFPALKAALKPGGLLVYKTYTLEHRKYGRGPNHPMYFLKPNELLRAFSGLQILHYHETVKEKGVAELVARHL